MAGLNPVDPLANDFYFLGNTGVVWDPWPVDNFRGVTDVVFKVAKRVVRHRNYQCIDNVVDRIVLLPASSDPKSKSQGGSCGMWLYSIRSHSILPVRVILWMTPAGKVMVRHGVCTSRYYPTCWC